MLYKLSVLGGWIATAVLTLKNQTQKGKKMWTCWYCQSANESLNCERCGAPRKSSEIRQEIEDAGLWQPYSLKWAATVPEYSPYCKSGVSTAYCTPAYYYSEPEDSPDYCDNDVIDETPVSNYQMPRLKPLKGGIRGHRWQRGKSKRNPNLT